MRFVVYLISLLGIELIFYSVSFFLFPELTSHISQYSLVGFILLLIFISKYIFLALTKPIQDSKPDFWVNANLLAFAAKFILIIGLMLLLTFYAERGAKSLIVWTALLYSLLLSADIIYNLKSITK